jgi:hypothetical protein
MLSCHPSPSLRSASFILAALLVPISSTAPAAGPDADSASKSELRARLDGLNHDIATRGMRDFPGSSQKLLTGYAYGEFYDWDLYFENVYLSFYGVSQFDFSNLQVFLGREQADGFISRTLAVKWSRPRQMFKPFLAQLAALGSQQTGSYEWLRAGDYGKLQKYLDRWFAQDSDHNGLPTWNSSDASGMDNQISRSGDLDSYFDEGVDLACYLYRELDAMSVIADKLGMARDAVEYRSRAKHLAKLINDVFWDEKDGFYYDRNEKTGQAIRVKSVAGFFPLWAGVASPEQARRLVREHLVNTKEFWLTYPVPTYARTEPDFYEGTSHGECNWRGNTWIPSNYMIFHGLMRYGFHDEARQLAEKTYNMALRNNVVTREYYNSETGQGYGMNPFWGWSSLAYVMPLEYKFRYDPTDFRGRLRPLLAEKIGVRFPPFNAEATARSGK